MKLPLHRHVPPLDLLAHCRDALAQHKLRSALSVLGVVLGIGAITSMMSVGLGARAQVLEQVDLLGVRNVVVRSRYAADTGGQGLTRDDVSRLRRLLPQARLVTPLTSRYAQVHGPVRTEGAVVVGVESAHGELLRLAAAAGRFLSSVDDRSDRRVCVLGATLARRLFAYRDPIGQAVRLDDEWYRVVGVMQSRSTAHSGVTPIAPRDFNRAVLVPFATMAGATRPAGGRELVEELWIQVRDSNDLSTVAGLVDRALAWTRPSARDYEVIVPRELLAQQYATQRTFAVVIGSIALVSLLVGGIGIMNVMLASVVERTSEIGLRRTVGATRRSVLTQFVIESTMLTAVGGILGIIVGVGASWSITAYAGWPVRTSTASLVLALLVSCAVGIAFGTYPALRAARLQPIDAVRYE